MRFSLCLVAAAAGLAAVVGPAQAREFPIGGPVTVNHLEIEASYLVGIEMAPMPKGMAMGPNAVHLETDVHATADNPQGFAVDAWIPYMTIDYTLTRAGSNWHTSGRMLAMTAKDGPHYANNVEMPGPGSYTVVLRYTSPESNGFLHHVDAETGVPGWWPPFEEKFTFEYPQK